MYPLILETFNKLGDCQISERKGGNNMFKKDFFNIFINYTYPPTSITTIYSLDMKRKSPNSAMN